MRVGDTFVTRFFKQVLERRYYAVLMSVVLYLYPLFSWVALIMMSLVTLRKGSHEGRWLFLAMASTIAILAMMDQISALAMWDMLIELLLTWLVAMTLASTMSWSVTLVGWSFGLVVTSALLGAFATGYEAELIRLVTQLTVKWQQAGLVQQADLKKLLVVLQPYWVSIHVALLGVSALFNLGIARSIQAKMFNPGGLAKELLNIRLGKWHQPIIWLLVLLAALSDSEEVTAAAGLISLPLVLAGLSLVHWRIRRWAVSRALVLVPGYLVFFTFMPFSLLPLMVVALLDTWFDFRHFSLHADSVRGN